MAITKAAALALPSGAPTLKPGFAKSLGNTLKNPLNAAFIGYSAMSGDQSLGESAASLAAGATGYELGRYAIEDKLAPSIAGKLYGVSNKYRTMQGLKRWVHPVAAFMTRRMGAIGGIGGMLGGLYAATKAVEPATQLASKAPLWKREVPDPFSAPLHLK